MIRIVAIMCMLIPWASIAANNEHSFDSQRLPRATPTPFRTSSHEPSIPRSTPKSYHTGQPAHWLPTIQDAQSTTLSFFERNKYRTIHAPLTGIDSSPASSIPSPRPFSFTAAVSLSTTLTAQRQQSKSVHSFVTVPPELHTQLPAFTFTVRHPATHSTSTPSSMNNHNRTPIWASGRDYRLHLLRNDIKRILQMQPQQNTTLDRLLENNFNLHTADPVYVFILPAEASSTGYPPANRTLVLHRSNFQSAAIYPNISAVQRRLMRTNITRLNRLIDNFDRLRPNQQPASSANWTPPGRMTMRATPTPSGTDLEESESVLAQRIVAENVRTEPNFLRFMQLLNQAEGSDLQQVDNSLVGGAPQADGGDSDVWQPIFVGVQPIEYSLEYTTTTTERPAVAVVASGQSVSWKDLGLDGWLGGIKEPGQSFHEFSQSHHSTASTSSRPQTAAWHQGSPLFKPNPTAAYHYFAYQTTHTRPAPTTPHFAYHTSAPPPRAPKKLSYQSEPPAATIPRFLAGIIPPELANLLLDTQGGDPHQPRSPRWPITSSRAQHTDSDVFIGRANNPFGHSTKWQMYGTDNSTELPATPQPKMPRHLPAAQSAESPTSATVPETLDDALKDTGRSKRGALLLYSMIKCATGCDPLMYKGYGCYCGFLGSGRTLDGIDRCCQAHDKCYVRANCPMFLEYFVPYLWKCYRGRPLCAIDHGEWGGPGSCASRLCECDQRLSKCLRRFYCPRKRAVCTSSPWRLLQNVIML